MGLSARKRIKIGPAYINLSGSGKNGTGSSLSLGTKNRKKGALNVTFNSRGRLTFSLYGTGIRYTKTKTKAKSAKKSTSTKSGTSNSYLKNERIRNKERLQREREVRRQRKNQEAIERKLQKQEERKAKIQNEVDSLATKLINKTDSKLKKITTAIVKNMERLQKGNKSYIDISSFWQEVEKEVKDNSAEEIKYRISDTYYESITSTNISESFEILTGIEVKLKKDSRTRSIVFKSDELFKYYYHLIQEEFFDTVSHNYTNEYHTHLLNTINSSSNKEDNILSLSVAFGFNVTDYDENLFDQDIDTNDKSYATVIEPYAHELITLSLETLTQQIEEILQDEKVDSSELEYLQVLFTRIQRVYRATHKFLNKEELNKVNEIISHERLKFFNSASKYLFSDVNGLDIARIIALDHKIIDIVQQYELYRDVVGLRSEIEEICPLTSDARNVFENIYHDFENNLTLFVTEIEQYFIDEFELFKSKRVTYEILNEFAKKVDKERKSSIEILDVIFSSFREPNKELHDSILNTINSSGYENDYIASKMKESTSISLVQSDTNILASKLIKLSYCRSIFSAKRGRNLNHPYVRKLFEKHMADFLSKYESYKSTCKKNILKTLQNFEKYDSTIPFFILDDIIKDSFDTDIYLEIQSVLVKSYKKQPPLSCDIYLYKSNIPEWDKILKSISKNTNILTKHKFISTIGYRLFSSEASSFLGELKQNLPQRRPDDLSENAEPEKNKSTNFKHFFLKILKYIAIVFGVLIAISISVILFAIFNEP